MTRKRKLTRLALATAVIALALGMVTACSDGADTQPSAPGTRTSSPAVASAAAGTLVDSAALGDALENLAFAGKKPTSKNAADTASCLVDAVRAVGLSEPAQALVVTQPGDDWGHTAAVMRAKAGDKDATRFLGSELRQKVDACVATTLGANAAKTPGPPVTARTVQSAPAPQKSAPNLTAAYDSKPKEEITSVSQIQPGLVSMLSSFAKSPEQKTKIATAGPCLGDAVLRAGFSAGSLHFFVGGAPLGSGSVVEHLATDKDKQLWTSTAFMGTMSGCLRSA